MARKQKTRRGGRRPSEMMTPAQRRTYDAIRDFMAEHGFAPTMKELSEILGLAMTPVNDSVSHLVRKGYLSRKPHTPRGLRIERTPEDETGHAGGFVSIGLYGVVAAGQPVFAEENRLGEAMVPAGLVKDGTYFALKVQGDSMTGAGIRDGDLVVVKQQPLARSGDIVVAAVDGETTLKRLHWSAEAIELRPENKRYKPIRVAPETDLRIYGVVVETGRGQSA